MEDVRVPVENRIGEEGEGFLIAMSAIDQGRFTVAAGAVGLAQACLDASIRYAHERETFGEEIGRHQLVKQMIANMAKGTEIGRLLVFQAGALKNRGLRNTRETSLAKWHATDHSVQAALDAIQIHGANGYSNEFPVERYLRNSKAAVIYEGTSQLHTLIQADYALGYREDRPLRCEPWPAQGFERPALRRQVRDRASAREAGDLVGEPAGDPGDEPQQDREEGAGRRGVRRRRGPRRRPCAAPRPRPACPRRRPPSAARRPGTRARRPASRPRASPGAATRRGRWGCGR